MTELQQEKSVVKDKNLQIIFLITLMGVMGVASISPAFPTIRQYFNISTVQVGYLITSFTLPGIFLTPLMGVLADRFGRKTILLPSLLIFAIGGVSCMFTRHFDLLLAFRFVQGIGAASLGSLNITLIGDLYNGPKRSEAMGYNASVLSIGTASYPAIGGILSQWGWYYPFLLPLLAIPVAFFVLIGLKNPEPTHHQDFKTYFRNALDHFAQRKVWAVFVLNILIFVILYGAYLTYFPQMLKERFNASSVQIGLLMSGFSVITAITSAQLKNISKILNVRYQLFVSFSLYLITTAILSVSWHWAVLIIPIVTFGIAHGIAIPGIQNILVGYAPMKERAVFMSINSMVLRTGQTIGPMLIGLFYTLGGTSVAFLGGSVTAFAMLVILALSRGVR